MLDARAVTTIMDGDGREPDGTVPPVDPDEEEEIQRAADILVKRIRGAYALGVAAIVGAAVLGVYSFCSLADMPERMKDKSLEILYMGVGGHVLVTIALVWFLYQLLRAAERMALPRGLSNNPEIARTLLGIRSPQGQAQELAEKIVAAAVKASGFKGKGD